MAHEIIINKRFATKLRQVFEYLEKEWGHHVAHTFLSKAYLRINVLQSHPYIGSITSVGDVRSTSITKHNRMYYRVVKNKVVILNLYDTRRRSSKKK